MPQKPKFRFRVELFTKLGRSAFSKPDFAEWVVASTEEAARNRICYRLFLKRPIDSVLREYAVEVTRYGKYEPKPQVKPAKEPVQEQLVLF